MIALRSSEWLTVLLVDSLITKLLQEVVQERHLAIFLDLMERHSVQNWFDKAAVVGNHSNSRNRTVKIHFTKGKLLIMLK